jgi:hypothetical protein
MQSVEVSMDGGASWTESTLGAQRNGRWAWRPFSLEWHAQPGEHELCVRARDAEGHIQDTDSRWNLSSFANDEVQRIPVVVAAA